MPLFGSFPLSEFKNNAALLLVGHGTRDADGLAECRALAKRVSEAGNVAVEVGFIELAKPTIGEAFDRLVERGAARIRAVPLLLFAAGHAKSDVPAALHEAGARHPNVQSDATEAFGLDEHILNLSQRRYVEALADKKPAASADTYLLMVGRGSSDAAAAEEMGRFAAERARRSSVSHFGRSFVAAARPMLEEGLEAAAGSGRRRIVVQPHLLFRGAVLDEVHSAVERWRTARPGIEWILTSHLGPEEEVVNAVLARLGPS
jgi:sirohydrochlorin ferrochelatase